MRLNQSVKRVPRLQFLGLGLGAGNIFVTADTKRERDQIRGVLIKVRKANFPTIVTASVDHTNIVGVRRFRLQVGIGSGGTAAEEGCLEQVGALKPSPQLALRVT